MAIKLVAIDLDDTLLDARHRISEQCITDIRRVRNKGIHVTLATGRMYQATLPYARQLALDIPLIAYQGALVKSSYSGEVFYYQTIATELALELLIMLKQSGVSCYLYCNDTLYLEELNDDARYYARVTNIKPCVVPRLEDTLQLYAATEIMVVTNEPEDTDKIEACLTSRYGSKLHITRFKDRNLELMDSRATKANALEVIAGHYNIKREEVMAIGDGYNDLPMIKWAGIGVAMGNAPDIVKAAADYITLSNEEEGVSEALRRFILVGDGD